MNPHKINPADKKGKKSYKGVFLKIVPKILPRQAIITPVEIVIQKGPKVDLSVPLTNIGFRQIKRQIDVLDGSQNIYFALSVSI